MDATPPMLHYDPKRRSYVSIQPNNKRDSSIGLDNITLNAHDSTLQLLPNTPDIEAGHVFSNTSVHSLSWELTVTTKGKTILDKCSGHVNAGEVLALMGPSGCGKTTLLNTLAGRCKLDVTGHVLVNGQRLAGAMQDISSYLQQDDVNIAGLTVEQTVAFTSRLANPDMKKQERLKHSDEVLRALGLQGQRSTRLSSPFKTTLSGGQKRRLGLATALVTSPRILFLDEPTSGLDSAASHEVMTFIRKFAKTYNILVIASIHQPSASTMGLFDSAILMSQGKMCYAGPRASLRSYFSSLAPIPDDTNPVEFLLDAVNTDFGHDERVHKIWNAWQHDTEAVKPGVLEIPPVKRASFLDACWVLLQRSAIKSYRDPLVYGSRLVINLALALVIGTVWLRLSYDQISIQPFVNCLFFSAAFEALISIAYAPAVIEDIRMLEKEHANRLYSAGPFIISNLIVGLPWLALISFIFSIPVYWLSNLRPTSSGFFTFFLWLFIDLLAAESMVLATCAWIPHFIMALAVTAFLNGLWLAVGGFLVPVSIMNAYWHYAFHYIDFQAYVFKGLMVNQFRDTAYDCRKVQKGFFCMYESDLEPQGKVAGTALLRQYGYGTNWGTWVGISVAIILVHRIIGYLILLWRVNR